MRSAIRGALVWFVAIALAVFVLVTGFTATALIQAQQAQALERTALEAAFRVGSTAVAGDPVELPVDAAASVGLYLPDGRRAQGSGPVRADASVAAAVAGRIVRADAVVAVPVVREERTIAVVRAQSEPALAPIAAVWAVLIAAAGLIVLVCVAQARRTSRRLAAPIERLQTRMGGLGLERPPRQSGGTGIVEIDSLDAALTAADERVREQIARERDLAATTSHQLRTPLTGLRARLENGRDAPSAALRTLIDDALTDVDRMDATVNALVALARPSAPGVGVPLGQVLQRAGDRWRAASARTLAVAVQAEAQQAAVPGAAVDTVLDVLLDNAAAHGTGEVTLTARRIGTVLALDVADEGLYTAGADGIGLPLARRTAQDAGGRLVEPVGGARTRFTLLLPGT